MELMQRSVAAVKPDDSLEHAARMLRDRACGCVVVVDRDRHPVGVVTDRDICLAALRSGEPLDSIPTSAAMSATVWSCRMHDEVEAAERTMARHRVRRLPVVDSDSKLVGILSLDDLALEACREENWTESPISCAAVGRTLGEIARHRLLDLEDEL
jgi:CBS domain-containing protein